MKLRTRGGPPPRRPVPVHAVEMDEDADTEETPLAKRRQSRRSVAPRAAVSETPVAVPVRPRARTAAKAPKGGVQKRKVARPTARVRPAPSARPSRAKPAKIQDDELPATLLEEAEDDAKANGVANGVHEGAGALVKRVPKTIDDLPEEVMMGIFSYFRPPQLCWKIGRVCRRWASWSVAPFLWRGKDYVLSPDPNLSYRQKK